MTDTDLRQLCEVMANQSPAMRLTPFVGSGVSLAATGGSPCAGWGGLLRDGIEICEQLIPDLPDGWADRKRGDLENADGKSYLSVAEDLVPRLRECNDGEEIGSWIQRAIGGLRLKPEGRELIQTVLSLGDSVVTTNYDNLIEQLAPEWPTCTWIDDNYRNAIKTPKMIVHLHGFVAKPESIILSASDYERLRNVERAKEINKSIFLANRFLFIGCGDGLSDPNIGPLLTFLEKIKLENPKEKHYLLVTGSQLGRFRQGWQWPLVVPVAYGNHFSELTPFLKKLKNGEPINVSQNPRDYERQATNESMSLLSMRRTAQQKMHEAARAMEGAAAAMRDVELQSDIPTVLSTWEPDLQEPVHQRKAASLVDAVAHLESCMELLVSAFEAAEFVVWPLTAPRFARLAAWVAPVAEKVSELDDSSRELLEKVILARDNLYICADIYNGYRTPYTALKRASTNMERATEITSSLRSDLGRLQEGRPSGSGGPFQTRVRQPSLRPIPSNLDEATGPLAPAAPDWSSPGPVRAGPVSEDYSDKPPSRSDEMPRPEFCVVPLFEAVGAGNPLEADENPVDYLALASQLVGEEAFLVLVRGESMMGEDGVLEGDYLIVDRGVQFENGDMVVAFIFSDSGAMVKRIWQDSKSVWLESSNPAYEPKEYAREDVIVHGKVTGIIRPRVPRTRRRGPPSG